MPQKGRDPFESCRSTEKPNKKACPQVLHQGSYPGILFTSHPSCANIPALQLHRCVREAHRKKPGRWIGGCMNGGGQCTCIRQGHSSRDTSSPLYPQIIYRMAHCQRSTAEPTGCTVQHRAQCERGPGMAGERPACVNPQSGAQNRGVTWISCDHRTLRGTHTLLSHSPPAPPQNVQHRFAHS